MARVSADDLRQHLRVLEDFASEYRSYISTLETVFGSTYPVQGTSQEDQRERILRKAPRAQRAVDASGVSFAVTPPPAFGGPVLHGLPSQVMAHENPTYAPSADPFTVPHMVLDSLTAALGALEDKIEQAEREGGHRGAPAMRLPRIHVPTLWGHLGRLPHGMSIAADVVTVIVGVAAILAFLIKVVF